jgi:HD superfamily phosphodiesterase
MNLIAIFNFVKFIVSKYSIDESHGLLHSMIVLNYAKNIFNSEVINNPYLIEQEKIIYTCAILHDMCDKKYMDKIDGLNNIKTFLISENYEKFEIEHILNICDTMSYSYVKKNGFSYMPDNNYQLAYHIVRESDLLAALDFDRCMVYNMNKLNGDILSSYNNAIELFNRRMFKHNEDKLYITEYSKNMDLILKSSAHERIKNWKNILKL